MSEEHCQSQKEADAAEILKLKNAINERISLTQQRARMTGSVGRTVSSASLGARRVSPIKEEASPSLSPSLEETFASPLLTTGVRTTSTESTESTESARTVRGSVAATTSNVLRTPSYPFPYVPGSPRVWSSPLHRPFTMLSPTISSADDATPREAPASDVVTPIATGADFLPEGITMPPDDLHYPTPNLYEIVLALNMEPGINAWWTTMSRILHENFGATRASLAVPADAGELENVPWGQKATFNADGPPEVNTEQQKPASTNHPVTAHPSFGSSVTSTPTPITALPARPKILSRHSYAGHERDKADHAQPTTSGVPVRPKALMRTATYAQPSPASRTKLNHSPETPPSSIPASRERRGTRTSTFSDLEFSSTGSEKPTGPFVSVLPVLRALNYETDALLDTSGVNRIIERGKLVTLTRNYVHGYHGPKNPQRTNPLGVPSTLKSKPAVAEGKLSSRDREKGDYFAQERRSSAYEEYEQHPTSPWAQSPAPSPAIQADPEDNPFFSAANLHEESFIPSDSSQDYSRFGQVEAIGVDKASTVAHIPLVHPLLSQTLPVSLGEYDTGSATHHESGRRRRSAEYPSRKAPIAILSLISPIVPFAQNLAASLKLLAPHFAVSFALAYRYTDAHRQATGRLSRRGLSTHRVGFALLAPESEGLENLMEADIDMSNDSATGSMTSPSDYSGRSRASPGGSMSGTPGWDNSMGGFSSRHSASGTPGHQTGTEMVDSYFDSKRRSTATTFGGTPGAPGHSQMGQKEKESPPDARPASRKGDEDDNDHTPKMEPVSSRSDEKGHARSETIRAVRLATSKRQHSQLHSYGADFSSTFQSLPSTTTPLVQTPAPGHSNSPKGPDDEETHKILPPSERLLRTIIDCLPVQIFTANPGTGAVTWVNSKFIAYRGGEMYTVLRDPWQSIHPSDRESYMEQWHRSLSTGQPFSHKVRLQRFDRVYRWFFVRATPLKDRKQKIVHWTGTYMDIHEQHVAEVNAARQAETAASEAKYRTLANSSPQIVFAVTRTRGLTFCNSQWLTYSGQTEVQARELGFMNFVHPDDLDKCRLPTIDKDGTPDVPTSMPPDMPLFGKDNRRASGASGASAPGYKDEDDSSESDRTVKSPSMFSPPTSSLPQAKLFKLASTGILKVSRDADGRPSYSTEVRLRNKDGEYRWHLVRVLLSEPTRQDGTEEETWYGTCTDINDHKLLEQTLKDTMDAKTRFLSNMSHEIRTPLNGITGMVNFLIDSNLSPEQMEHVNIIRNSTEGLRDLINDILDLSKVEAGMITLQMEWLHVRSLIEEVNDLTSAMAIDKGLELNYIVADHVPSRVKGDRFRIRQVLLNVVGNAIKFTQHGEVFVNCAVYEGDDSPQKADEVLLEFQVVDTGSGFTEKEAEYLFKRFSQIDSSSTRQHSGTGLGLAISMQLVELHGGKMKASSVPGKGSTFTFTINFALPTADDAAAGLTPSVSTAQTPGAPPLPPDNSDMTHARMAAHVRSHLQTLVEDAVPTDAAPSTFNSPPYLFPSPAGSSGSSNPSVRTGQTSLRSDKSSVSSLNSSTLPAKTTEAMNLSLPFTESPGAIASGVSEKLSHSDVSSAESVATVVPPSHSGTPPAAFVPTMYSILVVCPLQYARMATVRHIEGVIPEGTPHHITPMSSLAECRHLLVGDGAVIFSHVVLTLWDVSEILAFLDLTIAKKAKGSTCVVLITDLSQRREIAEKASGAYEFDRLSLERRLRFVWKPLKPSKVAVIFDPQREREMSTDRNQDSAQAVAVSQKLVFDNLRARLGNRGIRVLLVEDNRTNQMVLLKFLKKVAIMTDCVMDGVQCTDRVFEKGPDYYHIILCDLHMPNKDGYQTCKDIRRWERRNNYPHSPIIALSANVLGDVYAKCVEAGFNSYVTKPVDFKELSMVMTKFLDPEEPGKPHEFMDPKAGNVGGRAAR
ncbi:hypothetical protein EJ06DRAFT_574141 [Trichodelitschia bisporula]|uniref:histidine kinase n=1 Tax=Trichodelitschia bisporula TaxID=703511 RepID=A0A6G1I2S8_9PEZI|nr:hypothetical protein EJ06DRAFT_574141 [Trichodelitschia bisporula]